MERTCEGRIGTGRLCRTEKGHYRAFEEKVESCTGSLKRCPIDCKLSKWSKVTCRVACGVSEVKYSDRFVLVSPQYGGKKCGVQKRPVVCEGDPCIGTTGEILLVLLVVLVLS